MQILLANAKIMFEKSNVKPQTEPKFQKAANILAADMAQLTVEELSKELDCNHKLAAQNWHRYQNFFNARKMPALFAYNGQAYKHLRASSLNNEALSFGQNHLWITCFFSGLLRPMDGIVTYQYEHLFDWKRVRKEITVIQPLFYICKNSDLKMQAVWAKTCRGAMVRFILQNQLTNPEELNAFSYEGFEYAPRLGEKAYPHFVKEI